MIAGSVRCVFFLGALAPVLELVFFDRPSDSLGVREEDLNRWM